MEKTVYVAITSKRKENPAVEGTFLKVFLLENWRHNFEYVLVN